jgi:hypothetical protein
MQEVQIKAPKHEFTLLCDDIRQEMGGKTSLMGLYDHHIVVPQIPFVLPKVCFYTRFSRMDGTFKFSFSIVSPTASARTSSATATWRSPTAPRKAPST